MIAHNPLHGSGQAGFRHPALALGEDVHAMQGTGMTDGRRRQPARDEAPHAIPKHAALVAAPRQRAMPEPPYLESKDPQRVVVLGHSVISVVPTHHRLQPLAQFGFVHASLKFDLHRVQLRLQPFANCLPQCREPSVAPLLHTDMCEAKKVERFRLPFSTPLPLVDRKRTELQQSRFLRMQFQLELPHSFRKFRPKLIGIRFAVKAHHDVVRESHHDDIAVRALLTPCLDPQIEYVVKIDVCQKRRSYSSNAKDNLASGRLRKSESPSAAAHWNRGRFAESGSSDGWLGCLGQREPPSRAAAKSVVARIRLTS